MLLILELIIILFLFIGPSISVMLGWNAIDGISVAKSVPPILYLLLPYVLFRFESFFKNKFYFRNAIIVIVLILLFRVLFDRYLVSRLGSNLLTPLLFSFFIGEVAKRKKSLRACKRLFIALFIVEIGLAIFERLTNILVFPYSLYNPDDINGMVDGGDYFRSNSLLGHPLSNALCVSVVLSFIAVSSLKASFKYLLLTVGFVALLCFNGRFAIVISFSLYFLYNVFKNKFKVGSLLGLGSVVIIIMLLVSNLNLGDRLLSEKVSSDDTSILARIDILDMIGYLDSDLLFKGSGLDFVEQKLGLLHIENWLLIVIFDLGFLAAIYYVYLLFKMTFRALKNYNLTDKLYIFGVFFLVSSSNNSLATGVPVLSFMFASIVLIPYYNKELNKFGPLQINHQV